MKYGIKHINGKVNALSQFESDLPAGFIEITKPKYDEFLGILETKTFVSYDNKNNTMNVDGSAEDQLAADLSKLNIRERLKVMSVELDLKARLQEDATDLQADFDGLAVEYRNQNPA
jgi:hypothetical protein